MRRRFPLLLTIVVAVVLVITAAKLDRHRMELVRETSRVRAENTALVLQRSKEAHDIAAVDHAILSDAKRQVIALERARQDVIELEQRAVIRHAEIVTAYRRRLAEFSGEANGHDPEQAPTKLEHFQNVGRTTPSAAFQTLVWAALKGDEAAIAAGLSLDDRALTRAEVMLASLPDNTRAQSSPEKLAALWFEGTVVDVPAAQIIRQEPQDPTHTLLLVRGGLGDAQSLTMRLGSDGWQLVVPERALEALQKKVLGASPPLSRK